MEISLKDKFDFERATFLQKNSLKLNRGNIQDDLIVLKIEKYFIIG